MPWESTVVRPASGYLWCSKEAHCFFSGYVFLFELIRPNHDNSHHLKNHIDYHANSQPVLFCRARYCQRKCFFPIRPKDILPGGQLYLRNYFYYAIPPVDAHFDHYQHLHYGSFPVPFFAFVVKGVFWWRLDSHTAHTFLPP
jgi:hypothetical protein